jgi:Methylmalonyl-CoA mutase, N-terminal domain/subunit
MSQEAVQLSLPGFEQAHGRWRTEYDRQIGTDRTIKNRSRIEIKPLYTPRDWNGDAFLDDLGFPGQSPYTRGIYPTMHRGRTWTQRQLIGLGTPEDYNKRVRVILDAGATAISLLPCNSGFRGVDCDEVDPVLLGTCGTVINTTDHYGPRARRCAARPHLDRDERPLPVHAARLPARGRQAARRSVERDHRDL